MQFLAKHYEKIILAVLLLLFGFSMIYLVVIISSADELKAERLQIKPRKADWKDMHDVDFKNDDFVFDKVFLRNSEWLTSTIRDKDMDKEIDKELTKKLENATPVFSDLLIMAATSRCPHCSRFVPRQRYFREFEQCPFCKEKLPDPGEIPPDNGPEEPPTPGDMDSDGIPDVDEEKWGLNPRDPSDAADDMDDDGFSNLIEYKEGTDLKNPQSHPDMYKRLYLSAVREVELDPVLMKVTVNGEKKEMWDIQINTDGGTKTKFMALGDSINLEPKRRYKIVDVVYDVKMIQDGNVEVQRDESKIVCESDDEAKLRVTMQVGKVAFSPLKKAFLKDIGTDREFGVDVGDKFRVGNRATRITEYTVRKIDIEAKNVEVSFRRDGKVATGIIGHEPLFKLNRKKEPGMGMGEDPALQGIPR